MIATSGGTFGGTSRSTRQERTGGTAFYNAGSIPAAPLM